MSIQAVAWVLERSAAEGTDRLVLLALANHADERGEAWPSIERIAHEAKIATRRTVQRSLRALEKAGRIEATGVAPDDRIPANRRPTRYRIVRTPERAAYSPGRGDTAAAPNGGPGATPVTSRGDTAAAQTISEPSLPGVPNGTPARPSSPMLAKASELLTPEWERRKAVGQQPTCGFVEARKRVREALEAGWDDAVIRRALPDVMAFSRASFDLALTRAASNGNGHRPRPPVPAGDTDRGGHVGEVTDL